MNRYTLSCGCVVVSHKQPNKMRCDIKVHNGVIISYERLCKKCGEYYPSTEKHLSKCKKCLDKETNKICMRCGKKFVGRKDRINCDECGKKRYAINLEKKKVRVFKEVIIPEVRKFDCENYPFCLDKIAKVNGARVGCNECHKYSKSNDF